jgi:galactokinase
VKDAAVRIAEAIDEPGQARWFQAPGRVNLIGDHTDYNEGFVLPLAIDRSCVVAARPATTVRLRSLDAEGGVEFAADGSVEPASVEPAWGRYIAGVVRELAHRGRRAVGVDCVIASDVPLGSGLSSSAALEVACALSLLDAAGFMLESSEVAEACRAAEEAATGVPCGIMDQLVSLAGMSGSALLIDCRSFAVEPVPLPAELSVVVVHSGISRRLATSAYAERRRACEQLASELGLSALRDATSVQVADKPFGRHVVSENERVLEAARLLASGDLESLGRLLSASHASLRDDFDVSTPELDVLVEELLAAGAFGARLTGAGFGGCIVALCSAQDAVAVAETATKRYARRTALEPTTLLCRAVDGAGPIAPARATLAQ